PSRFDAELPVVAYTLSLHDALPIYQYRPDSITVNLLANDELEDSQVVTANDEGEWTFAFTDLAQFDEEGKEIEYTIEEEAVVGRSEEHTSELQSRFDLVCRLLPEEK